MRDGLDTIPYGDGLVMYYSANWQLLEEHIDDGFAGTFTKDRTAQEFWGIRYIDDPALRRIKATAALPEQNYFHLTDAQFSTVAMVNANNGLIVERVEYTPYGEARHHWGGDVNGDGAATIADDNAIVAALGTSLGDPGYFVEGDLDRSGAIGRSGQPPINSIL